MTVARPLSVGMRVVDSLPFSMGGSEAGARALKAHGVDAVALYLGAASPALAGSCLASGLGVFGVTFGGHYDGPAAVAQAKALGLPSGTSVFLDVEGDTAMGLADGELIGKINGWADAVAGAAYLPGLYVGVPQPLTSAALYGTRVVRYWRGQGSIRDRSGALAEPTCGWCMTQMWPSQTCGGILVDWNIVGQDYHGRVPSAAWA